MTPTSLMAPMFQASFGASVSVGDANGDGLADIAVGAPLSASNDGTVYLFQGASSGVDGTAHPIVAVDAAGGLFGSSVSVMGDLNGGTRSALKRLELWSS